MERPQKSYMSIPNAADMDKLSELHKAMGDFTRMKILWILIGHEYCVNELAVQMNMSESAISHQLRTLRSARLVCSHKIGKKVFYSLQDEDIKWILQETYTYILYKQKTNF